MLGSCGAPAGSVPEPLPGAPRLAGDLPEPCFGSSMARVALLRFVRIPVELVTGYLCGIHDGLGTGATQCQVQGNSGDRDPGLRHFSTPPTGVGGCIPRPRAQLAPGPTWPAFVAVGSDESEAHDHLPRVAVVLVKAAHDAGSGILSLAPGQYRFHQ